MSLSKKKMDYLDNEKRKKNKEYLSDKEYDLIKAEDYMVVKDNRLMQKATFDFSELEMKCINYAISKMQPNKTYTENDLIELSINELCKLMKIKDSGTNYYNIRQAFFNIHSKMKIVKIDENTDMDFTFFNKVYGYKKGGIIKVSFYNEMLKYLQNLKGKFAEWELFYTLKLKNKYAIRMYELCKSYQKMGHFTFRIDLMRIKWCISDKYSYYDIKRKIILPSINEINNNTDIVVEIIDIIKKNKKIVALELKIIDNSIHRCMIIDKERKEEKENE